MLVTGYLARKYIRDLLRLFLNPGLILTSRHFHKPIQVTGPPAEPPQQKTGMTPQFRFDRAILHGFHQRMDHPFLALKRNTAGPGIQHGIASQHHRLTGWTGLLSTSASTTSPAIFGNC
jgi:hypothetical protein